MHTPAYTNVSVSVELPFLLKDNGRPVVVCVSAKTRVTGRLFLTVFGVTLAEMNLCELMYVTPSVRPHINGEHGHPTPTPTTALRCLEGVCEQIVFEWFVTLCTYAAQMAGSSTPPPEITAFAV